MVVVVILLAGMAFPILLLVLALAVDLGVLSWVAFHEGHARWMPRLMRHVPLRLLHPLHAVHGHRV
jgi:hypothetical protein